MNQKGFAPLIIIVIATLIIGVGIVGFLVYKRPAVQKEMDSKAQKKGFSVLNLEEKRANHKVVNSMLKKREPSLIFFNGHGNEDSITGHNNESLI